MDLRSRIVAEIDATGPMRFSRYMELALYDEHEGALQRRAPGPDGHFVTAPHLSAVFVEMLAIVVRRVRDALGGACEIVDLGAGDGSLLAGLAAATGASATGVDRSAAARDALTRRGLRTLDAMPADVEGLVICNELFDNVPFDLADAVTGAPVEIATRDGALVATGDIARARPVPSDAARATIAEIAASLRRGYVLVIDYADPSETVRGYRAQRPVEDLLEAPGETDVTGPVDIDLLAAMAKEVGLHVQARTTQRELLHGLGYRAHLDEMRARQEQARTMGDHATEIALWNARGEAAMLVDPQGMGGFGVLVLASAGLPPLLH